MAKRFYNTQRIEEDWYLALSLKHRELLRYCESKCDGAGVFSWNARIASTYIGVTVTDADLAGLPILKLDNGKHFIAGFCIAQNGHLSKSSPAHKPIFRSLEENSIDIDTLYNTLSDTLYNRDKEIEKEIVIEKEIQHKKQKVEIPTEDEFYEYAAAEFVKLGKNPLNYEYSIRSKYQSWVDNGWADGLDTKIKNWKSKVKNSIPYFVYMAAPAQTTESGPVQQIRLSAPTNLL